MEPNRPGFDEIERAFAYTQLEPEVTDVMIGAYADGTASEADREIVETMMEVDPAIAEAVSVLREELSRMHEPLPRVVKDASPKSERKRSRWLIPAFAFASVACVCILAVAVLATEHGKLALARREAEGLRGRVAVLKERLRMKGLVVDALGHGLQVPGFVADLGATRGEIQLDLKMTPNKTLVRPPVSLAWSGQGAQQGTGVSVELSSLGSLVWKSRSTQGKIDVPSSVVNPGKTYSWRVVRGTDVSDWSSFRVCTETEARQASAIASDPELSPMDRGILYAQCGLVSDAYREFDRLKTTDPALADRLIRQLDSR